MQGVSNGAAGSGTASTDLRQGLSLDRDGTLIGDRGHLRDPGEVVFLPDAIEALRRLKERLVLFIVTNQPGVAEGEVGDHPHDVELARRAGARGLYVLTGHGAKHRWELGADTVVMSEMLEAAERILRDAQPGPGACCGLVRKTHGDKP